MVGSCNFAKFHPEKVISNLKFLKLNLTCFSHNYYKYLMFQDVPCSGFYQRPFDGLLCSEIFFLLFHDHVLYIHLLILSFPHNPQVYYELTT